MPSTCEFQLNNPNAVYHSGDTVSGAIVLHTTAPKVIRDIRIIFRGEAKVCWSETESRKKSDRSSTNHSDQFKAHELYVDNSLTVCGEGTLPAGTHAYRFEIHLPSRCPTSCEGAYGHIRYELTLKLNRTFRFDNEFSKPMTVVKLQDLNLNPAFRFPIESEEIFSTCCWNCTTGNINSTLTIPFGGYAIGQNVKYSLHVQNQSMDDIVGYEIEFYRIIVFTARTPHLKTREEKTTLHKKAYATRCLRLTTRILDGNFLIESTPPTTEGESIICVRYTVKATLNMIGFISDHVISLPIFIGTVPVRESMVSTEPMAYDRPIAVLPTAPEQPLTGQSGNDLPPSYHELGGPPSFEEATGSSTPFIDTDRNEHNRHTGFRPLYPSYSRNGV